MASLRQVAGPPRGRRTARPRRQGRRAPRRRSPVPGRAARPYAAEAVGRTLGARRGDRGGRSPSPRGVPMTTAPALRPGSSIRLRTRLLAVVLALHGVAHFAGTTSSLDLVAAANR